MKHWIIFFVVLALSLSACRQESGKKNSRRGNIASRTLQIEGYVAENKTTPAEFKTSGELLSNESVELKTETSGKILKIYLKDGAKVSKGTLIAKLYDR